VLYKISQNYTT